MQEYIKNDLEKLTKEQLVYLISRYYDTYCHISNILVNWSKSHFDSTTSMIHIRDFIEKIHIDYNNKNLSDYINMKMGRISLNEYRDKIFY